MKLDPQTHRILIVGLGLMGGSYASGLSKRGFHVDAITKDKESIDYALAAGMIERGAITPDEQLIKEADLVIFALYPHVLTDWIRDYQHLFRAGTLLTDVTGVKAPVLSEISAMLRPDLEFIAAHPMAGRESSGVFNSDDTVFAGANYVVTPTEHNTEEAIALCEELGETLGFAHISRLAPDLHDEVIAFVSQLTHCIAVALMTCNEAENLEVYTGDSFRDLTRIARMNDEMWSELFLLNKEPLLRQIDLFSAELSKLRELIAAGDAEGLRKMMRASTARRALFDKKKAPEKSHKKMNMTFIRKLPLPDDVKSEYPLTPALAALKAERDAEIRAVFEGKSDKFLLIIGPCSADLEDSVIDYISRLRAVQEKVSDKILIIPRIYTGKPRTTGDGYKGMIHQPNPHETPDLLKGLLAIRELHMRALRETGFSCADEMLYPENYRYLDDLLAYVAIGARSVEDQHHRLVSSGLDIPVGMKNPMSGDVSVMMNSITAAQHAHAFIYRGWEVRSTGNPYAHAILRGYVDERGNSFPNYHYEDLANLASTYETKNLQNPAVIIDTNHSNSGKRYLEQIRIATEVVHNMRANDGIRRLVKGLMIESYIEDGAQKMDEGIYGKSITDPCLGWEKTERLILDLADLL